MAWKEFYSYTILFSNLAAGSGTTFTDGEIRFDTDSDFEFVKTMMYPNTAKVRVSYRDDTSGRFLQKGSQDIRTISGHAFFSNPTINPTAPGFLPFIWPRPYIISAATTLTVSAADFSGIESDFRLAFHGSKIRPGEAPWSGKYRAILPYIYSLTGGTIEIPANGSISVGIPTDQDAHFVVHKMTGTRDGSCTVTIKDASRDRQWMNSAVHFDMLIGNGTFPHNLSSPRFIARGSTIAVTLTDLSGSDNTVELNFIGTKIYE